MLKSMNKKMIITIAAAVATVIAVAIYLTTRPVTLDLHDYLEYEINGFDGNAHAYVSLDELTLEEDVINAAVKKGKSETSVCISLLDDVLVEVESAPVDNLKNGDKIKVTYKYDNKKLKQKYGVKFKNNTDTITVEGLEEAKVVDVFEHLDLVFSGAAPSATTDSFVNVTIDGAEFTCEISPSTGLDIGDELTIKCKAKNSDIPIIPKETKTTIKVPDTISHYILKPEELTTEDMQKFQNSLQVLLDSNEPFEGWFGSADIFVNSIADTGNRDHVGSNYCTISNITITNEADYFAGIKSGEPQNKLMLRFELDATVSEENRDDYGKAFHCYGFCYLDEIIREDGKLTFDGAKDVACSDLYTTEADRENALKDDYADSWNELTQYRITLDGSKKPELVREAINQYESN